MSIGQKNPGIKPGCIQTKKNYSFLVVWINSNFPSSTGATRLTRFLPSF